MNQLEKQLLKRLLAFALVKGLLYMGVRKLAKELQNG